ncbi:MAG: Porphobilinogen deaminase [uncultured Acidimicrobiales bacterium]|uniref:Hydroxymethylbilane synthase n=1 Tax=uncultured Acidimicrobiales bacterium TaxID=310071 RepID=A0A6J4IDW9_9ACTN|nr:MAG: Porphobilinogen deaminase [uncultured Acidimicrobiales bacterium]
MSRVLRIATRASPLARWQAERVATLLGEACEVVPVESMGDRLQDRPIHELGGQGVFVKEVQAAVQRGEADLAVHSAKDLPSGAAAEGLVLACVPERADVRDCLVGATLDELASGAVVATGSVRRRAQLAALRPDLAFSELRGNMATRLAKVPNGGAVVAAAAALQRLGSADRISQLLEPDVLLPQVAQGALAVECRADDLDALERLAGIEDPSARRRVDAERAFLARLGGGCDLPVGALATDLGAGRLRLEGLLADPAPHRVVAEGQDPTSLGLAVAEALLAGPSSPP